MQDTLSFSHTHPWQLGQNNLAKKHTNNKQPLGGGAGGAGTAVAGAGGTRAKASASVFAASLLPQQLKQLAALGEFAKLLAALHKKIIAKARSRTHAHSFATFFFF